MLPEGGRILDLGCGSGRDSLAFLKAGFAVNAVDGSAEMASAASELTGMKVEHATFADFEPKRVYDGIWACSSLLHVPAAELPAIVAKYAAALKPGGRFYLSFKLGDHDGMRNGRWFTDMTEQSFRRLIDDVEDLTVDCIEVTSDVRPGRADERWLNAWCMRI
nr:class I SAM-dependent methyltransferase [Collinsella aerofaciens]